jgi:hypothetical protein
VNVGDNYGLDTTCCEEAGPFRRSHLSGRSYWVVEAFPPWPTGERLKSIGHSDSTGRNHPGQCRRLPEDLSASQESLLDDQRGDDGIH